MSYKSYKLMQVINRTYKSINMPMIIITTLIILLYCYLSFGLDAGPLHEIDSRLTEELSEPTDIVGQGDLVLKDVIAYYCNLYTIYHDIRHDNKRGMETLSVFEEKGGPKLTMMEVNREKIKAAYKWEESDFVMLTKLISSVKDLWNVIKNKIKTG